MLQIAARIVARASRETPADSLLRQELRDQKGLTRFESREISRAVFAWFRWRGWLQTSDPMERQLTQAVDLADRFHNSPQSFSDGDFAAAVPSWTAKVMEVTPAWLRTLQTEPRLWLRAKRGRGGELANLLGESWIPKIPALADAVVYQGNEDLFRSAEFHAGEFEVQDVASQAVSLLCAPAPGETWWDACAGEGGKTLHLSDLMQNKGLIWASDRADWRLKRLKLRTGRAKCFNYRAVLWDGGAKLPTKTKFDGVLLDAPCSGVGTWQRNPHARWTTTEEDVAELAKVQADLLSHVASSVKPGGKLIYSVCTLTKAETVAVAQAFAAAHAEFEPLDLPSWTKEKRMGVVAPASSVTIWPQDLGGNGMFVAAWRRRA